MRKLFLILALNSVALSHNANAGLIKNPLKNADTKAELSIAAPAIADLKQLMDKQMACLIMANNGGTLGSGALREVEESKTKIIALKKLLDDVYSKTEKAFRPESQASATTLLKGVIGLTYSNIQSLVNRMNVMGIPCQPRGYVGNMGGFSKIVSDMGAQSISAFLAELRANKTFAFVSTDLTLVKLNPEDVLGGTGPLSNYGKWVR